MNDSPPHGRYRSAFTAAATMLDSSPLFSDVCVRIAEEPCDRDASLFAYFAEHGASYATWKGARQVLTATMSELRAHVDHEFAAYVPVLGGDREPDEEGYDLFRRFLWTQHRSMAPNVNRPAVLNDPIGGIRVLRLLSDYLTATFSDPQRLQLLNVGAAAGLELVADALPGQNGRLLSSHDIIRRRGVDISPIDPDEPGQLNWMLAFLEPEEVEAQKRITDAIRLRPGLGVVVDHGDAFDAVAAPTEQDALAVVFGVSFLCSVDEPARMDEILRGRRGDVIWIADEAIGVLRRLGHGAGLEAEGPTTRASVLTHYRDGDVVGRRVAPEHS